jgi:competence ComEA-like helix-hairpin-helix protein
MKLKEFSTAYLGYTKKERIGVLCIVLFILFIILLPLLNKEQTIEIRNDETLLTAIDSIDKKQTHQYKEDDNETAYQYQKTVTNNFSRGKLFTFDPNTLSAEGWKKLGLKERTIQTIENYRIKGGKFYKAEDVKKIWGLPDGFYEYVKDFITITAITKLKEQNFTAPASAKPEKKAWNIEINNADTTALIQLPGIGSKLAIRIINFREKLGGFYSIEQIKETYGLADSTFQKIKSYLHVTGEVKKINVNAVTKDELKTHPYFKWNLANAIVEYRNQHGNFKSLEELKNIAAIKDETFIKLSPYLSL